MTFVIAFPAIDPILIELGPLAIRWYGLAYLAGLLLGWRYVRRLAALSPTVMAGEMVDDLIVWITFGVILGGRLGYILFYRPLYYLANPLEVFVVWEGGMAFHGGLIGVLIATAIFCRRHDLPVIRVGDLIAAAAPIGLFFGRLANFINGELFGRASDAPWAMIFPNGGAVPRHPSQLYQAGLEGLALFIVLAICVRSPNLRARPGLLGGTFLTGYGIARMIGELFRQPDAHIGFLLAGITMGQLLSIPMLVLGLYLIVRANNRGPIAPTP